ncbi:MAG: NADH-quinone oxidoreductase subunit H [Pseudomonadota bacterium]
MGVGLAVLWTLLLALAGSALVAAIEPHRLGHGNEPGPAAELRTLPWRRSRRPDRWLHGAAPVVALIALAWAVLILPFGRELIGADLGIGLFYFLVVVDILLLAVALGGWGADTADAVECCYRVIAQLVAYVVPLGLAVIGPAMMARSLSTVDIVEAQARAGLWYVVAQPLGFALFVAAGLMQSYRAPFLEPFAQRLQQAMLASYAPPLRALWRVALSGLLFVVAAMGATLFLGGYAGPWLPGWAWMLLKTLAMIVLMLGLGRCFALRSSAQMLALSWKLLIPLGLLNVLVVGALILLGVGQGAFR